MRNSIPLAVFSCFTIFMSNAQAIKTQNSLINFEVSNMALNTVKGTFNGMEGTVLLDENNLGISKIEACIDATTINTNNEKRDKHLREADFFDTDKFPTICFSSTSIKKTSKGYVAKGKLTMHGITKDVEIPLTYTNKTVKGNFSLKRRDYKIGEDTGTFMVGNKIEITIQAQIN